MAENKTKIIITRKAEWMNRLRPYKVFIDAAEAGAVKNNSSEEFIVAPGAHKVQCKMSWLSSREFNVNLKQDEIVYLKAKNALRFYLPLMLLFVIGVAIRYYYKENLMSRPTWVHYVQLFTLWPFVIYVFYYYSLGRKNYFLLDDDKENVFAK